jgi:hypothetical protein
MNVRVHDRQVNVIFPALAIVLGLLLNASTYAQEAIADTSFVAPVPTKAAPDNVETEKPAPYDIGGIVAKAFKMKKPLQMLSPFAPAKDGDGHDNVSWDPDKPEKPKGIILLGIQW